MWYIKCGYWRLLKVSRLPPSLSLSLLFTSFLRFVMFSKSSIAVLVLGVTCAFVFGFQRTVVDDSRVKTQRAA